MSSIFTVSDINYNLLFKLMSANKIKLIDTNVVFNKVSYGLYEANMTKDNKISSVDFKTMFSYIFSFGGHMVEIMD